MGVYIQGLYNLVKAKQLMDKYGATPIRALDIPRFADILEDKVLVSVVENGPFDAALVVVNLSEYLYVLEALFKDERPRQILMMDKKLAFEMSGYSPVDNQDL